MLAPAAVASSLCCKPDWEAVSSPAPIVLPPQTKRIKRIILAREGKQADRIPGQLPQRVTSKQKPKPKNTQIHTHTEYGCVCVCVYNKINKEF